MAKRSFSSDDIETKSDDYHGGCRYVRTQPDIADKQIASVNIEVTFDEAMRLALAIQSAVLQLNRYKRSTTVGKEMGLLLSIKTDSNAISVIEKRVRPEEE